MPKRVCKCGQCTYCKAYTQFEMDQEFGTGGNAVRSGETAEGRMINRLHFELGEEMCAEFGTGGTTREQRKARHGEMSDPLPGAGVGGD